MDTKRERERTKKKSTYKMCNSSLAVNAHWNCFHTSVGGPWHHSLFMNKRITHSRFQAGRLAGWQAALGPLFLCHAEFAHNSRFFFTFCVWNNLDNHSLKIRLNFHHLNTWQCQWQGQQQQQKNQWLLHTYKCYVLRYVLILSQWVLMCAHLGAFYCSTLHTQSTCVYGLFLSRKC